MDGRTGALLACSVLVLAAGCVGGGGDEEAATASNATALEPSTAKEKARPDDASAPARSEPAGSTLFPGAIRATDETNATDLRVAEVTLDDPARLEGFTWQVPEDAVVEDPYYPFDDPQDTVVLRGVAVAEGPASSVEAWGLLAFHLGGDTAEPLSTAVATPVTVEVWDPAPPESSEHTAEPSSFLMTLGGVEPEPGDRIGFVLAARGQAGTPFGVAFQPLVDPPEDEFPEPPEGLDELRETAPSAVALPREGSGTGLHVGTFVESTGAFSPYRYRLWTEGVDVEEGLSDDRPPGASARSTSVTSSFAADGGWSTASAGAFGEVQAGRWQGSVDLHGVQVEGGGPHAYTPAGLGARVTGFPYLTATGEGPGGSEATYALETASIDQLVFFEHLALGEPLETLVGQPTDEESWTYEGQPVEAPTWRTNGDQWVFVGGPGPSLSLLGVPLPAGEATRPG